VGKHEINSFQCAEPLRASVFENPCLTGAGKNASVQCKQLFYHNKNNSFFPGLVSAMGLVAVARQTNMKEGVNSFL
jgi:hypothetical protein